MRPDQIKSAVITLVFAFSCAVISAQPLFQRLSAIADTACSSNYMTTLSDGSIIIVGVVNTVISVSVPKWEGVIWKIDQQGNILWTNKIKRGSAAELSVADVLATADGGFIVLMNYYVGSGGQYIPAIVKFNGQGNTEWVKKTAVSKLNLSGQQKITGGYLVSGYSGVQGQSPVLKIDESGNVIWGKIFNAFGLQTRGVYEYANGDLLVPGDAGGWVKFDSQGEVLLIGHYGDPTAFQSYFGGFKYCVPDGDSLLFVGDDYVEREIIMLRTDHLGNPGTAARFKTTTDGLNILDVHPAADGGYVLLCYPEGFNRPHLIKLNKDFTIEWAKSYGRNDGSSLAGFSFCATADGGGYWLTGDLSKGNKIKMYLSHTDIRGDIPGICCSKPVAMEKLPCPILKTDLPYTLSELPEIADGTIASSFTQTLVSSFCETSHTITLSDTTDICPAACITVGLSGPQTGSKYTWNFPGATPDSSAAADPGKVCYTGGGNYRILLQQDGCLVDSSMITVDNSEDQFPNAFTPNGDDHNATFKPWITCPVEGYSLQVFDRWGTMVFQTTDPDEGWDGAVNGKPAPVDVYVYRVQYYVLNGTERTLVMNRMKEVTLLR